MAIKAIERTTTGIAGLDLNFGGGIPKGSMIVLAGEPGTGKTTFAAQFLYRGAVDYNERGIYVSFIEDRRTFMNNMRALGFNFEELEKEGKFRFLEMLTVKEMGVPETLNMILKEIMGFDAKRLVLDSFTALAQAVRETHEIRVLLHTFLNRFIKFRENTTIIITEKPYGSPGIGLGIEEFIADCVIVLKRGGLEGRTMRELEVLKSRGLVPQESRLLFTIKDGFKCFMPFTPKEVKVKCRFKPIPEDDDKYSSGSKELDGLLGGGYPKGSLALMEIDPNVAPYHKYIMAPTMWNFLAKRRGLFIVPSPGVEETSIRKLIEDGGFVMDEVKDYVRIFLKEVTEGKLKSYIIPVGGKDIDADLLKYELVGRELRKITGRGNTLYMFGMDTLVDWYGEKAAFTMIRIAANAIRRGQHLGLMILKPGTPELSKAVAAVAEVHLKLIREHGCLLLYGIKPRTPLHVVELDVSDGYPQPKLTPLQ
ncbi:MAG: ATPase domain-containing protein [Candidatus Nezhaarchaeales archaeon]